MREWRNGRRAGFRHQFRKSEGSTPFSRTTKRDADSLKISADFILITHSPCNANTPESHISFGDICIPTFSQTISRYC